MNSTQEGIRYSDTKATLILTLYGVVLTIIYSNSEQVLKSLESSNYVFWFSIISIVFALLSILFAFLCINPRLKNNNAKSIIYFGHIQKKFPTYNDYHSTAEEILSKNNKYTSELAEQVHTNSIIAWNKFSNVTWCIRFLFGCLIFLIFSLFAYLL